MVPWGGSEEVVDVDYALNWGKGLTLSGTPMKARCFATRLRKLLPAHLGSQPNNRPAILCPARVHRFLTNRPVGPIGDDDEAVGIDTTDHQILADRVRSVFREHLVQEGIPPLIRMPLAHPSGLAIRNQPCGSRLKVAAAGRAELGPTRVEIDDDV